MPLNTSGMSNVVVPGDKASASVSKGSSPTAEGLVMAGSVLLSAVHFTSPASLAVTETRSDKPTCVAVTVETMGCTPSGDAQHQAQRQPGEWRLPRHLQARESQRRTEREGAGRDHGAYVSDGVDGGAEHLE